MANWMYGPDELLAAWGFADVGVILSRHANGLEALALLSRRERHGELIRLADGVRVRASVFAALTGARRVLLRIIATALTWTVGGVVSHESAAAVHELALLRSNTGVVHTIVPVASGGRSTGKVRRHAILLHADEIDTVRGLRVTTLARTVADLAAHLPHAAAVAAADSAMSSHRNRPLERHELLAQVSRRRDNNTRRGVARIEAVAQFADGRAESPKESESRVVIAELGFAAPELQYEVFDADGLAGRTDFAWPSERTLGEYDGKTKYFDEQLTGGLSPEQILWKEKRREERLRAAGFRVVRWDAADLATPARLAAKLRRAGVPRA